MQGRQRRSCIVSWGWQGGGEEPLASPGGAAAAPVGPRAGSRHPLALRGVQGGPEALRPGLAELPPERALELAPAGPHEALQVGTGSGLQGGTRGEGELLGGLRGFLPPHQVLDWRIPRGAGPGRHDAAEVGRRVQGREG